MLEANQSGSLKGLGAAMNTSFMQLCFEVGVSHKNTISTFIALNFDFTEKENGNQLLKAILL